MANQGGKAAKDVPSRGSRQYLIAYNLISAILWSIVMGKVALIASTQGTNKVYAAAGEYTKWVQTLAVLEILHSLLGIVRSPLVTTAMQVASRIIIVWGILDQFPAVAVQSLAYSTMLVAWSVTEMIRYSYFVLNLAYGRVPPALVWLRYNTFFALYPLGISSEWWLVRCAIEPARRTYGIGAEYLLRAALLIYVPGSYVLFTHMMAQRRKIMRGKPSQKDQ